MSDNPKPISRRDFLKITGRGIAATAAAATLHSCGAGDTPAANPLAGATEPGAMTYRTNPTTGDKVSLLGYGCMRLPTVTRESGRDSMSEIDQEMVNRQVDHALAHGVNYFDTAPVYCKGRSEKAMGIALSRHPRESYLLATKMSNFSQVYWPREKSLEMYHDSFKKLKTSYIDYMLLHNVGGGGMEWLRQRYYNNGILDFLLSERAAGRIRNLGFSYHGDVEAFDYLLSRHDEYKWDFVQIQLNYLDWRHAKASSPSNTNAEYLYGELAKRGIPAVIMEPLLGGRLARVPSHVANRLLQKEPGRSVASWALRFAGTWPGVLTVLSGMTYMEHLQDNIATYSPLKPLDQSDLDYLEATAKLILAYPTIPCNECDYCMPCPYGIDIPRLMAHYNRCVNEGFFSYSTLDDNYRKARRAFLVGYGRAARPERQADHCVGCRQCVEHCPQGIDIPKELARIDQYAEKLKQDTL